MKRADDRLDPIRRSGDRLKAPSLEEFEVMAIEAFRRLPENFRALCADLVIRIDDFPTDEVLDKMERAASSICSACFRASACRSAPKARRCTCRT